MSKTSKIILAILSILAFLLWAGCFVWLLSSHDGIGMLRVNAVVLYVFLFVVVLGLVFTGLALWFWLLDRKGRRRKGLFTTVMVMSVVFIALFSYLFVLLGVFPPSKDITPITQLPLPGGDGTSLHFAVGSDAHIGAGNNDGEATEKMLEQIRDAANGYELFFFLGDMMEYGFSDKQWEAALKVFTPTAEDIPMRLLPGNHDTIIGGLSRYLAYAAPDVIDGPRLWQRIDTGRVHFLLLDVEWSAGTFTGEQADWLETQLKSIPPDDWTIVMSHGFYYVSGLRMFGWNWYDNPETINAVTPLLEKYSVDMVFSGHKHSLEILEKSGVTYAVCGAFGGHSNPVPLNISPYSLERIPYEPAFVEVTIEGDTATVNFRNAGGNVLKSYTVENQ